MYLIDNQTVADVLDMKACVDVIERAFRGLGTGETVQRPRTDIYAPSAAMPEGYYRWGSVEGAFDGILASRLKSDIITWQKQETGELNESKYAVRPGTYCGLVLLFSTQDGSPLAILNDGYLQHVRVGASAGIGARHLSRPDSAIVGLIGSGGMARTYLEAFCAVRAIGEARVYSRSEANRTGFAEEMSRKLGIAVHAVDTPEAAVRGADIVSCCTSSVAPVLDPDWLEPGMHVTHLTRAEIPPAAMDRFDVVVFQGDDGLPLPESETFKRHIGQSPGAFIGGTPEERRRLPEPFKPPRAPVSRVDILDILSGAAPGRTGADQITYHRNSGNNGAQFSASAGLVLRLVEKAGLGRRLPVEWFLQDIRN